MRSGKAAREQRRARGGARKFERQTNETDEVSSQSFAGDSGDHSRKSYRTERLSSSSSKKGNKRTDPDDTEDYFSDAKRRSKEAAASKRMRAAKSRSKESVRETISDEEDEEEEEEVAERNKKNMRRQKSKKRSENHSRESTAERDSSSVKRKNAKNKRKKRQDKDKSNELPITEILKKAQEHRGTKYEDPVPLPELTTDTIYVQGRNGFSAIRISSNGKSSRRSSGATSMAKVSRPIKVAIVFQKIWRSSGFIFQGLLGGMALLHFIFMEAYYSNSEAFVNNYSSLSEIYTGLYSFLIAMCIIATFDKFDLTHVGMDHMHEIFRHHLKSILAVPLYVAAFSLHQVTSKVDDKLSLVHYNFSNVTYYTIGSSNDTESVIKVDELNKWQRMTLSKDLLALLGWIFISIGNKKDMLLDHLESLNKYAENMNT